MLKKVALGAAALVLVLVVVIAMRPPTFHVERSLVMSSSPESVFGVVNDFHQWNAWSPWEKMDPAMTKTFGGSPSGVGSTYAWKGNDQVGEGRMTIEKSEKPSQIVIKLEFLKPFAATNAATFMFAAVPGGTKVTWAMDGHNNFISKAFQMFMDMDGMIGADFERGLAAMNTASASAPAAAP